MNKYFTSEIKCYHLFINNFKLAKHMSFWQLQQKQVVSRLRYADLVKKKSRKVNKQTAPLM